MAKLDWNNWNISPCLAEKIEREWAELMPTRENAIIKLTFLTGTLNFEEPTYCLVGKDDEWAIHCNEGGVDISGFGSYEEAQNAAKAAHMKMRSPFNAGNS